LLWQIQSGIPARFRGISRSALQDLVALNKSANELTDETGCDVLFLVWNMLSWTGANSDKDMYSPLLLMAVSLECDMERGCLLITPKEEFVLNPTLKQKWSLELDSRFPDLADGAGPTDLNSSFSSEMSAPSRASSLASERQCSVDEYLSHIRSISSWAPRVANAKMVPAVWLGIFNSSNFVLYNHIQSNRALLPSHPLVGTLQVDYRYAPNTGRCGLIQH
jgi:hypothetical protein